MTATDHQGAARAQHRTELLHRLDQHPDHEIPCRAVDLHTAAAWTADDDDEQRVAAAACRSMPCPLLTACRAYGMTWPDELGCYGGVTEKERRRVARDAERRTA